MICTSQVKIIEQPKGPKRASLDEKTWIHLTCNGELAMSLPVSDMFFLPNYRLQQDRLISLCALFLANKLTIVGSMDK